MPGLPKVGQTQCTMSPRLQFAIQAAYEAGRATLSEFGKRAGVERKLDDTPVTQADRRAERMLREAIAQAYPGEAILGEEEGASGSGSHRWVIDPIDGTKSFIAGVPLYATLLSLEVDGRAMLGVCYFPALDEMAYAERGEGAYLNGRRCQVSSVGSVDEAIICCGSPNAFARTGRAEPWLRIAQRAVATRTWGDAYGHVCVACGRVEAMIDPAVAPWDVSAVRLIVEEAGGRCTDLDGQGAPDQLLSSNGVLHEALVAALRP